MCLVRFLCELWAALPAVLFPADSVSEIGVHLSHFLPLPLYLECSDSSGVLVVVCFWMFGVVEDPC